MALDRISLSNFRNHAETAIDGTGRLNLLVGGNGAGKTNILEALSLLAPGRGMRRAALADMARQDGPGGFAIGASLAHDNVGDEPVRIGTYTEAAQPGRRRVRINSAETSAVSLGEWIAIGWLTPAMDGLFTGPAQDRRRYMDRLALALDPEHASHANRYEAALRERNRLLGEDREPDPAWLDAIEKQLAEHGDALSAGRARLVDAMMAEIVAQPEAPFPRPALSYAPGGPLGFEALSQALHDGRRRDRAAQRTLTGPHRDDLDVLYAAKRMQAAACSTGEQKALLLAMTLAHAALAARGRASLLLLDEVAAHLDPDRRVALFDRLRGGGAQVWMTGTETAPFEAIAGEASVWEVRDGAVTRP
ncbi:DNA replication/repair protein RecF [Erythrobacter sp. HI0063]|jgi:DNA replication and repair protein RecF|uniref:DNA replication/repair protein RecF n=1 Tax=Erythrobacter sp. HI0063 TaxID=1822240 RepID=UPI0007C3D4C2|nr:DNA replication/repair protein RecF [Erythrobacter sp. HI0063]KZY54325.1 DNA replication/repair protein RecF [Erythrobacter sp. HI0063]